MPWPACPALPTDLASGAVTTLVDGSDFYACPRHSPDGSKMAWVCWEHPNMPWDDTQLWVPDVVAVPADGEGHTCGPGSSQAAGRM